MKTIRYNKVRNLAKAVLPFYLFTLLPLFSSCSGFLEDQVPQGTLTEEEVKNPAYVDNVLISAYAGLVTLEDMNASFSLWNYDTRSDDAYVGGSDHSDGAPVHNLELATGVLTTDWPFSSIWGRFYQYLSRVNFCINVLGAADQENTPFSRKPPRCYSSVPTATSS